MLFGIPLGDLGWFQSLVMVIATTLTAFFLATFVSIVFLLFYMSRTHHAVDFAITYKRIGFPVGVVVGGAALGYFGFLWVRRILRKGPQL